MAGCPDFDEWGDHVFGPIHSLSLCCQSIHTPGVPAVWWMMAKVADSVRRAVLPELGIRCLSVMFLVAHLVKNPPVCRRPWFDSWVGKIRWRRDRPPTPVFLGLPGGSACKEATCHAGDLGLVPGLGWSLGEGKGYPLQYSGLKNSMDCIVHGVADSQIRLSDFHFHWDVWNCKVFTFYSHSYFCSQDCSPGYLVCGLRFFFFQAPDHLSQTIYHCLSVYFFSPWDTSLLTENGCSTHCGSFPSLLSFRVTCDMKMWYNGLLLTCTHVHSWLVWPCSCLIPGIPFSCYDGFRMCLPDSLI